MKRLLIFIVAISFIIQTTAIVSAQENDTTPIPAKVKKITITPIQRADKSKIDELKEKIASTVAQLNLVTKKGIIGQITKIEKNKVTIEKNGQVKLVDTDELTKYFKTGKDGKQTEIKFSDLDVTNAVLAIGLYNKESRKLLARFMYIKDIPININGVVKEVDIKDGTIKVEDKKKNITFTIDIEKTTKITTYSKTDGIVKIGISKIDIGERAHVNGMYNKDEDNRLTAFRILILPGKAIGITSANNASSSSSENEAAPTPTPKTTKKITPTETQ